MHIRELLGGGGGFVVAGAMLAFACSSSGDDGGAPVTTTEAGTPPPIVKPDSSTPDVPDTSVGTPLVTCGNAPFDDLIVTMNTAVPNGTLAPLAAVAKLTWSGCTSPLTTDALGHGRIKLSASVSPRSVKVESAGFIPTIFAETAVVAGTGKADYFAFPTGFTSVPGYSATTGNILVSIQTQAGLTGPCAMKDGVAVSVRNHPELAATYLTNASAISAGATGTTAFGFALIANVPPAIGRLEIDTLKTGCQTTTLDSAGIGLVPVEAGAISFVTSTTTALVGPTCGPGPYVQFGTTTLERSITNFTTLTPLPGVSLAFDGCPGVTTTSDANGVAAMAMTVGLPGMFHVAKTGYIDTAIGEASFVAGTGFSLGMRSDAWRAVEPGWSDAGAQINVTVSAIGTGVCGVPDGVSVTVRDHAEATLVYEDESSPPVAVTGGTATSKRGAVVIPNLSAGTYNIDVTTTKATCKVSTQRYYQTGRITSQVNARSVIFAYLEDM